MLKKIWAWCPLVFVVLSCSQVLEVDQIINNSLDYHGFGDKEFLEVSFDFREIGYKATYNKGKFIYERRINDSIHDILDNNGFIRLAGQRVVDLPDSVKVNYQNSINSVIYFALLPKFLIDPAVKATLLGQVEIKNTPYYKIEVSFSQEKGGDDYRDKYVYWIDANDFSVDYLAYNYQTEGGGARFREASGIVETKDIRINQYINYNADEFRGEIENLDVYYEKGQLTELSKIELENIHVKAYQ